MAKEQVSSIQRALEILECFMDVDTDGITILVNNDTADNDTVVYENFNVKYL